MKATIRDVAAKAGVSIATVSRVMNGATGTSEEIAGRVRAAVAELGFRPNLLSRGLKTAKSHTLGVLIPSLSNPVFAGCVEGIERSARAAGYSVLLTSSNYEPERESEAVETLLSNRVAGLILTVADADESKTLETLESVGLPYALLFNEPFARNRPAVSVDNTRAAADMTRALIAAGHRRIAMVAGAFRSSDRSRLRYQGFSTALEAAALEPAGVAEVDFEDIEVTDRLAALMQVDQPPTALFCSNDMVAIAVVGALRRLGYAVPDDVSVAGFDGIRVGELMSPTLATVIQPTEEMGRRALTLLLDRLNGSELPTHQVLPHEIRAGQSVAAPRRS